jgi:hypothetical protein
METFLRTWLEWPSVAHFIERHTWAWPLCETFHFFGIILLIGGVGMFDFCVVTGLTFVTGVRANVPMGPYDVIRSNPWLQLKFLFIALAGLNLLAFYVTGMDRVVDRLGPGDDAPRLAKAIACASLFLWLGVIYFGRLIPEGL